MPLKTINWDSALDQVGGDEEFLNEVLGDLLAEAKGATDEIADGISSKDFSAVMKAAHRIKGSASYLCCDALKQASLELQDAGHAGDKGDVTNKAKLWDHIEDLFKEYKECLADLRDEVDRRNKK